MLRRQKIFLAVVFVLNAVFWIVPSDVVELVARDRHTLLGRYSREHLSVNLVVLVASLVGFYIDQAPSGKRRRRGFQTAAVLLTALPLLVVVDFVIRLPQTHPYVFDSLAYHRQPDETFTVDFDDRPEAARSYLRAAPGYGSVRCVYHTDGRGYRNRRTLDQGEIVVLGDSFAEGSKVSDEQVWPVLVGQALERTVVNLGMSGYAPAHSLAAFREYGAPLSPELVLCLVYEGNDFRASNPELGDRERSISERLKRYFKQSPVRNAIDQFLIRTLGPIGSERELSELEVLSWLPLAVPAGPGAKYYAFGPKDVLSLAVEASAFRKSDVWAKSAAVLRELRQACADAAAELVVVYAPTKEHVMLPPARDHIPPEKMHRFLALRTDELPAASELLDTLLERLPTKRNVVREWCRIEGVAFCDLTDTLRTAAEAGRQVYYTYDQHWTPDGHKVVASAVGRFLKDRWAIAQDRAVGLTRP